MLIYFIVFLGYFSFLSRNSFFCFVFSSEFERDDGLLYCILQLLFIFIFPEKKKRIYVMVNIYYYVPDVIIENGGSLCFNLPEKQ